MNNETLTEDQKAELLKIQQEKKDRAARAMSRINSVLKEERCVFDVDFVLSTRPKKHPRAVVNVWAL